MESYSIVIFLLALAIGLYPVASRIKLPYPVLLLAVGIGVGFIPGFHRISINPNVVFLIFLPPMLYNAAFTISFKGFKANFSTISLLAVSLIFITTTGIAVVARYCIPGMTWPLAFVLGAILSPPDAVAAAGVIKGLGLPHRTVTILEGESLVNDASALVAFRFALTAVAGGSFVLWEAGLMFLVALGGGLLMGWLLWLVLAFVNKHFRLDSSVIVSLNLMLPFVAYLLAEEIHVSGVIAAVTAGLAVSMNKSKFSEKVKVQAKSVSETLIFILEGLIFILIGLEFPRMIRNTPSKEIMPLIAVSFLIFMVALVIRMAVVFWHKRDTELKLASIRKRMPYLVEKQERLKIRLNERPLKNERLQKRLQKRNQHFESRARRFRDLEPLNIKDCIIIGWSGMRGIVSLAAALSLPLVMANGTSFPQRNTITFLTVVTVTIMLLIQGLGLPLLIKLLKRNSSDSSDAGEKP